MRKVYKKTRNGGIMLGIGIMSAIDEILFHQILQWHHFYDHRSRSVGIMADGFLHAFELIFLVAGFFVIINQRKYPGFSWQRAVGGIFLGAGSFQLFDGLVNHKIFKLHQIRYVPDLWIYDLCWNIAALLLIGFGIWLLRIQSVVR